MTIAPVLANLGPVEELSFKPNPGEVQSFYILDHADFLLCKWLEVFILDMVVIYVFIKSCFIQFMSVYLSIAD